MQQAEVSRPMETLGQYVLQYQPEEVCSFQGARFPLSGLAFFIAEGHPIVLQTQDLALTDDTLVEVAGQVGQGRFTPSDTFALDYPGSGHALRQPVSGLPNRSEDPGPKDFRQGFAVEQIGSGSGFPAQAGSIQAATWHNDMRVWVVVQSATMGAQHGGQPLAIAQRRIVPTKGLKRPGCHPEQGGIGPLGMRSSRGP